MDINDITYQIRGAAYDVYVNLGAGLLESVYEEALVFELKERGLCVERQKPVFVNYKGHTLTTELRLDILVEDSVIIELKSVAELKEVHFKQLQTYLRLSDKHIGYLINFNTENILKSMHRVANNA